MSDIGMLANIKKYGSSYKLTALKYLPHGPTSGSGCLTNDHKLDCNISRARSRIFELAMCNPWQYFFTGTLDGAKHERSDLKGFHKSLSMFVRSQRRKHNCDVKYLLIPEKHSDGQNWHVHGLINGLSDIALTEYQVKDKIPRRMKEMIKGGDRLYRWNDYQDKYGWSSLGQVKNAEGVSKYITKYISKEVAKSVQEVGAHMYYASQRLEGYELIKKGTLCDVPTSWDYENDYVKILWFKGDEVNDYVREVVSC